MSTPDDPYDFDGPEDAEDGGYECSMYFDGAAWHCPLLGSEECDWDCPLGGTPPDEPEPARRALQHQEPTA